jgi:cysteine desulfurase
MQIYLDHGATTPVRKEVVDAMLPYWTEAYGNPSSVHRFGQMANKGLQDARTTIADLINCQPDEIIFVGCGSESDNLALRGVMWSARKNGTGNHLITSEIEHKAVLDTALQLRDLAGFDVSILPVDEFGQINLDDLTSSIRPDTVLISIMAANNEIGTVQPFEEIGAIAQDRGILFHTDAIQAAALINWDMGRLPIDLLSMAPHKFYGPKGIGILIARQDIELISTLTGGGQEHGHRAGTENVAFAVGAAEALRLALEERQENMIHYQSLRNRLIDGILKSFSDDCRLTGHPTDRLPNNASFAFRNISGNDLVFHLDVAGVSASSGSACLTGNPEPSRILKAIGLSEEWTKGGLRLTVGKQNNEAEIEYVLDVLPNIVNRLQRIKVQFA